MAGWTSGARWPPPTSPPPPPPPTGRAHNNPSAILRMTSSNGRIPNSLCGVYRIKTKYRNWLFIIFCACHKWVLHRIHLFCTEYQLIQNGFFFFPGPVFSFKFSGGTIYLLVHFVLWAKQCQFHRTDVKNLVFLDLRLLNFSTLAAVLSQTMQRYHHPLWHHKGLIPRTVFPMQCQWEEIDIVSKEWKN